MFGVNLKGLLVALHGLLVITLLGIRNSYHPINSLLSPFYCYYCYFIGITILLLLLFYCYYLEQRFPGPTVRSAHHAGARSCSLRESSPNRNSRLGRSDRIRRFGNDVSLFRARRGCRMPCLAKGSRCRFVALMTANDVAIWPPNHLRAPILFQ